MRIPLPPRGPATALLLCVAGGASANELISRSYGEEALSRMLTAYSVTVPCFIQYRYTQLVLEELPERLGLPVDRAAARARYQALHRHYAPRVFDTFSGLRGFYIKIRIPSTE